MLRTVIASEATLAPAIALAQVEISAKDEISHSLRSFEMTNLRE